jgi:hypothetical protein
VPAVDASVLLPHLIDAPVSLLQYIATRFFLALPKIAVQIGYHAAMDRVLRSAVYLMTHDS